jgi:hypothetical protein
MDAVAMANNHYIPADDEWTADDAFHHLTRIAEKRQPAEQAIYDLHESLCAGRVPAIRKFFVDGAPPNIVPIRASLWRHQLDLVIVEGRLVVLQRPPSGVLGGGVNVIASDVFLSARTVKELWPPLPTISPRQCLNTKTWLRAAVERRRAAGDIPGGHHGALTEFTEQLAKEMAGAVKAERVARALKPRSIETLLHKLKLWPIQ